MDAALLEGRHVYFAVHHNLNIINMPNVTLMKREEKFTQMTYSISDRKCFIISTFLLNYRFYAWSKVIQMLKPGASE